AELSRRWQLPKAKKRYGGLITDGRTGPGGPRVAILLPQTFMNESGSAAGPARGELGIGPDRVIAVHDEIDLPFGEVRSKLGAGVREELGDEGKVRRMELFARLYDELTAFPKPTVAACHGSVVGGGAEVAIACDLRVGGSNLRMRFPGAALNVPVGPARLVTLCGLATAKYLLLTSRTVSADEAL